MSQLNYLKWRGGASSRQAFPFLKPEFHVAMLSLLRHITGEFDLEFVFLLPPLPNGRSYRPVLTCLATLLRVLLHVHNPHTGGVGHDSLGSMEWGTLLLR